MAKVVESKIIIKGEDQASPKLEKVEASLLKVTDSLVQISKIPFLDPTKFERVGAALRVTMRDLERFMKMRPQGGRHPLMLTGGAGGGMPATRLGGGVEYIPPPRMMGAGFDAVPVRVVNWPAGFGGQAGLRGGGRLPVPREPRPPQPDEPSWLNKLRQLFAGIFTGQNLQTAVQGVAGGGLGGLTTGIMATKGAGGLLGKIGLGKLAAFAGPLAAFGGLAAIGYKAAGPAHDWLRTAGHYYYTIGAERLARGREAAARGGYMPEEYLGHMGRLAQFGGLAAETTIFGKAKYMGLEAGTVMPYLEAITRAGGAGARSKADYEKVYKELAAAIADKSKLPSIHQLMEQLVGLTGVAGQKLADIDEGTRQSIVALSKWGEEGPTAMLRGGRGAATWGKVAGWVAGAKEPAQQVLLYQMLSRDPEFRKRLSETRPDVFGRTPGTGPMPWYEFQLAREMPEAWMPALKGLNARIPNKWQAMRVLTAGTGMSNWEAMTLLETVQKHGYRYEAVDKEIKERTKGKSLEELMTGKKAGPDYREVLATKAAEQLRVSERMGEHAANIDLLFTRFFNAISPIIEGPLATLANPGEALKATAEMGPFAMGWDNAIASAFPPWMLVSLYKKFKSKK